MNRADFDDILLVRIQALWPDYEPPTARIDKFFRVVSPYRTECVIEAVEQYAVEFPDQVKPSKLWSYVRGAMIALGFHGIDRGPNEEDSASEWHPEQRRAILRALREAPDREAFHGNRTYSDYVRTMSDDKLWNTWLRQERYIEVQA